MDRKPILPNLKQMNYVSISDLLILCGTVVRDLGVWMDSELTMRDHISRMASSCFFHLHRLRQLHGVVCCSTMQRLVSALVLSRPDYCKAALSGLSSATLDPLRRVLNVAIRLVAGLGPRDHVTEKIKKLHWLLANQIQKYQFQVMSDDARRCDWSMPTIHS